jgi:septal ring factor EnvC (AmiA/AmiB activator)
MQKANLPTDIMRFRRYLGDRYCDDSNRSDDGKALQIYTIYFLGKDLGICDTPVLSVFPVIQDIATKTIVEGQSEFINSLNHKCWVVQINCLKERRRNELEQLLSVFDQTNLTDDNHILIIREEDLPEKFRPVVRRLKAAASNKAIKKQMREEDGMMRFMQDWLYNETKTLKEAFAEQDNTIKEQDNTIKEQDNTIKEQVQELDKKAKENKDLKRQIDELRKLVKK